MWFTILGNSHINCFARTAINGVVLTQCDSGLNPDGITTFNLSEINQSFLNNDPNLSVSYYENSTQDQNNIPLGNEFTNTTNPQQIIVRITDNTSGCYSLNDLTLSVNVMPGQSITPLEKCDNLGQENGFNIFDLTQATIIITPTQSISYYTTLNNALLEQNEISNTTSYPNTLAYNDIIFVRIEESNICSGISELELIVNKLPNIDVDSDGNDYVCSNLPNEFITINAAIINDSSDNYLYKWFLDGTAINRNTYNIQVNQAGIYTVEVSSSKQCIKTRTIEVKTSSDATIDTIVIKDGDLENKTVTVNLINSVGNYEYSIDLPNGPFQASNFFENVASGIHTVYINDINGCGLTTRTIAVIGFPKFFTPNGDGFNDFWKVAGVDVIFNTATKIYIFDRFGKFIKEVATRDTEGWDGTLNGKQLPSDDYWFVTYLEDGRVVKGHFALKR